MLTLWQDIRYIARMLRKNPGVSLIAVLTLALGIGANTTIFSVVNAVLLRPLPYAAPERLVFIYNSAPGWGIQKLGLFEAEFLRLRDQARALEQVSLYTSTTLTLTGAGEPERVSSGTASGELFAALGAPPALGRIFKLAEEPRGQGNVVILSHSFWQRKFAASPAVIGQSLTLDGRSYIIVGVLPQSFKSPLELQADRAVELWIPPGYNPAGSCCGHGLNVVARLRVGQTLEQAQTEINAIMAGVKRDYPQGYPKDGTKQALLKPLQQEITLDGPVLGFTLLVSLLTGIVFGLAPAWQALQFDLHTALKEGGRASASIRGRSRLRATLVVAEVALSLMLLLGAGLLIRSFWRLQQVDTGFRAEQLLTLRLFPPASTYANDQQVAAFYEKLLERVRSLPGVKDAAVTDGLPLGDWSGGTMIEVEGQSFRTGGHNTAGWHVVSPEFFRTLGVRLLRGRLLEDADQEQATPVAVVNETLARLHWPNEDPLGRRIRLPNGSQATTAFLIVVGVVADVKNDGLTEAVRQEVYVPLRQRTAAIAGMGFARQMTLAVRTSVEPLNLVNAIRQEVMALDRNVPIASVRTMEQIMATVTVQPRFNMILLGIFAAVALVLAAVGIYGVLSYSVTQRTHEIGLRLALGAQQGEVLKLVVRQGMILALLGVAIGLAASFALTRLLTGLLYGVSATDPLTFIVIALLLTMVALIACWIPARRATKVDPMIALRHE